METVNGAETAKVAGKVRDLSVPWDLQLTKNEWTIYWKQKYEQTIVKILEAKKIIDAQAMAIRQLKAQIHAQNALLDRLPLGLVRDAKEKLKQEMEAKNENREAVQKQ